MPKAQIDDDVYAYLQREAIPLEDNVSSVLRRLLEIPNENKETAPLPLTRYERAILVTLMEKGGDARRPEMLKRVGELLRDEHSEHDLNEYSSGEKRWEHRAASVRKELVDKHLLESEAGYGVWKLTEAGWTEAHKVKSEETGWASV